MNEPILKKDSISSGGNIALLLNKKDENISSLLNKKDENISSLLNKKDDSISSSIETSSDLNIIDSTIVDNTQIVNSGQSKFMLVTRMKERFRKLKSFEDIDDGSSNDNSELAVSSLHSVDIKTPSLYTVPNKPNRWDLIRKTVVTQDFKDALSLNNNKLIDNNSSNKEEILEREIKEDIDMIDPKKAIAAEDIELTEYWANNTITPFILDEDRLFLPPPLPAFEEKFVIESKAVGLNINSIPNSVISTQKEKMKNVLQLESSKALEDMKKKQVDVVWREHLARLRVEKLEEDSRKRIENERQNFLLSMSEREHLLGRQFRRAREELEDTVKKQNASIKENFGEILYNSNSLSRSATIQSKLLPQPIEMRIHMLRAVKTKLPKGIYVIMLTQLESLGGKSIKWSKNNGGGYGIGPTMPAITKPVKHNGNYFDRVLSVEDSCFALCPPDYNLKPSYTLLLEVYQLASDTNPNDRIVGWTAMPMCNEQLGVATGKFKLPLFKGEPSPSITQFLSMEKAIAADLSNWLCNIYIEIRPLSLVTISKNMGTLLPVASIEMDFISKQVSSFQGNLLNNLISSKTKLTRAISSMVKDDNDKNSDNEENYNDTGDYHAHKFQVDKSLFQRKSTILNQQNNISNQNISSAIKIKDNKKKNGVWNKFIGIFKTNDVKVGDSFNRENEFDDEEMGLLNQHDSIRSIDASNSDEIQKPEEIVEDVLERGYNENDDFFLHKEQKGKLVGIEAISTSDGVAWARSDLEGKVIRRNQTEGPRFDTEAISTNEINETKIKRNNTEQVWTILEHEYDIEDYNMSICHDPGQKKKILPKMIGKNKLRYLWLEAFNDFSYNLWGTMDFYITLFIYLFAFWFRIYIHFLAEFLLLQLFKTPVYNFEMGIFIVSFKYMSLSISSTNEMLVVLIGPLACIIIFFFFSCLGRLAYKIAGHIPDAASKFCAAFGIATLLDPVLTLIADIVYGNFNCKAINSCKIDYTSIKCTCFTGDFIKLWNRMNHDEGSGITGLLITLIMYVGTTVMASFLLYEYFIYVHRDGDILDLYRRINGNQEEFFIPNDYEITRDELLSICASAKKYRKGDSTRKVIIKDVDETDKKDKKFIQSQRHFGIYDIKGESKALYRHFVLSHDGTIIEIFDQSGINLDDDELDELIGATRSIFGLVAANSNHNSLSQKNKSNRKKNDDDSNDNSNDYSSASNNSIMDRDRINEDRHHSIYNLSDSD